MYAIRSYYDEGERVHFPAPIAAREEHPVEARRMQRIEQIVRDASYNFV